MDPRDRRELTWLFGAALLLLAAGYGLREPWPADDRRFVLSGLNPARFVRNDGFVRVRVETLIDLPMSGEYTAAIDQLDVSTR